MNLDTPDLDAIRATGDQLRDRILRTPVIRCRALENFVDGVQSVHAKLEFLQHTGTFKPRGALSVVLSLGPEQLARGITAVSAGNHAIAASFAAKSVGTTAKVVMTRSANPARVALCRQYGAEIVFADDVHVAFDIADRIREEEGRFFVHPFEGDRVTLGTATLGLEVCEQLGEFDAIVVPIGGGGLCAGVASAVKQLLPDCAVYGVEPTGADSMHRSFASGRPEGIESVRTIADSLGAPFAMPFSYTLCRRHVDELVLVDDDQIRHAMRVLFGNMRIAVEPACAASTAAVLGPLRSSLGGARVVLVMCGSNIDWHTFEEYAEPDRLYAD